MCESGPWLCRPPLCRRPATMRACVLRQKTPTPSSPDELYLPLLQLRRHRRHFSAFMNYFVVFGASWCGGVVVGAALISGRGGNAEGGEGGV